MRARVVLGVLVGALSAACASTPTPLAPQVSGSIGVPHYGVQTGAVELPVKGRGFARYRAYSPNYWGNPRLVRAIQEAALAVHEAYPGGAPLLVGDISARHGGKIPGHRSHRTGRDVDFLWYTTTPAGASVRSPGFVHVGSDTLARIHGRAGAEYVALDVERQWLLFKTLLQSDQIGVQFMFASRDIEALLIDYARSRGEPPELVWHAETVLLQPGDSTPHDDHVHLRIACTPEETARGCAGGGPYWEWLPAYPRLLPVDDATLREIRDSDPFQIGQAVADSHDERPTNSVRSIR